MIAVKESVKQVLENIPDQCSWDDLMYELYVRQKIDRGLDDIQNNRVVSHGEVCKAMGTV